MSIIFVTRCTWSSWIESLNNVIHVDNERPTAREPWLLLVWEVTDGLVRPNLPAVPLAGLGGPADAPVCSGGSASATGTIGTSPALVCASVWPSDLLLAPVRGPVWTFFGHDDCMGQGHWNWCSETEKIKCKNFFFYSKILKWQSIVRVAMYKVKTNQPTNYTFLGELKKQHKNKVFDTLRFPHSNRQKIFYKL